ncbi:MAG: ribulose-phosphate 3-epimerase [Promethearchaeota archaeon]
MKKVAISIHATNDFSIEPLKNLKNFDYFHVDVMDGKFVENKCLNLNVFKEIKANFNIPIIVHLMVSDPLKYIDEIIDYIDVFLFHFEIERGIIQIINRVKSSGKLVGIVLNPKTIIAQIEYLLPKLDVVLILGVEPGFSGQKFISETLQKIYQLSKLKKKYPFIIDVDGGVNLETIKKMKKVDILTSSSAILKAKDPNSVIQKFKNL